MLTTNHSHLADGAGDWDIDCGKIKPEARTMLVAGEVLDSPWVSTEFKDKLKLAQSHMMRIVPTLPLVSAVDEMADGGVGRRIEDGLGTGRGEDIDPLIAAVPDLPAVLLVSRDKAFATELPEFVPKVGETVPDGSSLPSVREG